MATEKTARFVALLRGINVGGKNLLPMKELVATFEKAGCSNVASYIQSGNVVFSASPPLAAKIAAVIRAEIERRFEIGVPVVVRSAKEIHAVVTGNPFVAAGVDEARLHVVFLADRQTRKTAEILDPNRSPGDSFEVRGGEIFLSVTSAAKTKITNAWLDSKLKTVSTGRNWRTVLKLEEMLKA